jgi:hypothetical protein
MGEKYILSPYILKPVIPELDSTLVTNLNFMSIPLLYTEHFHLT